MEDKKEMLMNPLPSPTWNWLKVNETPLKWSTAVSGCELTVEDAQQTETIAFSRNIETGAGATTDWIFEKAPAEYGILAQEKQDRGSVRLHFQSADARQGAGVVRVLAQPDSTVTVVMDMRTADRADSTLAVRTLVEAQERAKVRIVQILLPGQDSVLLNDIGGICREQAAVEVLLFYLGKGDIYNGCRVDLVGERSSFFSKAGYLEQNRQKLDINMVANHFGAKSTSDISADGTLRDEAQKLFRGTIDFKTGASGAQGQEEENVLLLGDHIVNKTVPLILCSEEDVVGTHGASIGELDDEQLFYFESRGIARREAEDMVTKAKIEKVCELLEDEESRELVHQSVKEVMEDANEA